jgi:hypothetical protein
VRHFCESQVEATGREAGVSFSFIVSIRRYWVLMVSTGCHRPPSSPRTLACSESLHRSCIYGRKRCYFDGWSCFWGRGFRSGRHGRRERERDHSYHATLPVSHSLDLSRMISLVLTKFLLWMDRPGHYDILERKNGEPEE